MNKASLMTRISKPSAIGVNVIVGVYSLLLMFFCFTTAVAVQAEEKQLYWGDTHLHTSNSFDAFLNRNRSATPETAYRYAKGLPVVHPYHRARVQIETPLDFLVVADHAELLGTMPTIYKTGIPRDGLGLIDQLKAWYTEYWLKDIVDSGAGREAFVNFLPTNIAPIDAAAVSMGASRIPNAQLIARNTWLAAIKKADEHYEPGKFTTFIGWEWSSIPGGANLHRVVFTSTDAKIAGQFRPYRSAQSQYPEDLWHWLDKTTTETGAEFIAIPHNSNISKGYMFPEVTIKGQPVTVDYARTRLKWEPVVEATQIKGDSETVGSLSPDDEFADFETYPYYIQQHKETYKPSVGDYVRSALKRGLEFEQALGVNPYKVGMIGSTDSHTGLATAEEQNFMGKMAKDSVPENKLIVPGARGIASGWAMSASGLAAVWAERNDRKSIMAAFKRREVYATSGPRIKVRFFAGWDFEEADVEAENLAQAGYRKGVPMGGDLMAPSPHATRVQSPSFLVQAARDPLSGNLDRIQMVKGWLDEAGKSHEHVFNIVWSDDRKLDANGALSPVGNTVDEATGTYSNTIGAAELVTLWRDPEFDPDQRAFYYARVLEIPTPRHALKDALALGMERPDRGPTSLQERAYTSPIWYTP